MSSYDNFPFNEVVFNSLQDSDYHVLIKRRQPGVLVGASLECSRNLGLLMPLGERKSLMGRVACLTNDQDIVEEFIDCILQHLIQKHAECPPPQKVEPAKATNIVALLSKIGFEKVYRIQEDLSEIVLKFPLSDVRGVYLTIKSDFSQKQMTVSNDCFPDFNSSFAYENFEEAILSTVEAMYSKIQTLREFHHIISRLESIFVLMRISEFGSEVNLITGPGRALLLDLSSVLKEKIDFQVAADHITAHFPLSINLRQNLETVQCKVCFQLWLSAEAPDISCCECQAAYHQECLLGWFDADRDNVRRLFGKLIGKCPSCTSGEITLKMQ